MSTKVRAKVCVTNVASNVYDPGSVLVTMQAIYTGNPEDNSFSAATPSATLSMNVSNPEAAKEFTLGRYFYLDFVPTQP